MTVENTSDESSDSIAKEDESTEEPDDDAPAFDRNAALTSRRNVLLTSGLLSAGGLLGVGTAAGQESRGTAPDTFAGFEEAIAETITDAQSTIDEGPYSPNWDSLDDVDPVPEWFRDAKFGLYFHLGPYSVPAYDSEWYPRNMYNVGEGVYSHHVENYGPPDEFPYQEFVPRFTAENFDADGLADLFERAGARFGGLVTKHADGFSNWDSDINHWNAGDMGPQRDLVGDLGSAIHERDMKFVTTFHHAYKYGYDYFEYAFDNFPSVTEGYPERVMYGNMSEELFHDQWLAEVVETLEQHDSDLVYFDSGLETISEDNRQRFLAYYYNQAANRDRDVVVTHKQEDLPLDVSVTDYEEGGTLTIADQAWLADTPISTYSWGYVQDQEYKSVKRILDLLVDSVSKNGQLMLNLSPRADGSIPQAQRDRILAVGDWLETNGEAIYETRPWDVYGSGPHWGEGFTAEDVRYTQSKDGDTVYAIVMGWPEAGTLTLNETYVENPSNAPSTPPGHGGSPPGQSDDADHGNGPPDDVGPAEVTLLGHGTVSHSVTENNHVQVEVPELSESERPSERAVAFELDGFDLTGIGTDYSVDSSDIYAARVEDGLHEVTVTVYNLARGEAPATTVRVENESNGNVVGEAELDPMALYGNTEVTVEWDTSELPDGSEQTIRATVDPADEVPEQDESNNAATTTVELPAWPVDLVPEPIRVTDMQPGSTAELTVSVENQGTQASGETAVELVDVTDGGSTTIANLDLPSISAGSTAELVYDWDVSGFETGTVREVEAVVDPDDTQPERDESNNTSPTRSVQLLGRIPDGYETYASADAVFGTWDDRFVVNAAGEEVWDGTDEYGAVYDTTTKADAETVATVKVASQEDTSDWANAGLMIRNDATAAGSSAGYALVAATPTYGFFFEWDSNGDGYVDTRADTGEPTYPCWLKLQRSGSTFTGYYSTDGTTWTEIGSADLPDVNAEQDVAMFVTSANADDRSRVEFDEFEVS